ncbi:unnamed protein product [Caenorhabditis bovis]|uniref:Uncharacterized protein n=1 Tax=Caenorhabditis bovis TaxID=2654633 RepID=A0A8S1F9U9_9PELO|nr:unnamed protein product [Caenorhabditis bovis]
MIAMRDTRSSSTSSAEPISSRVKSINDRKFAFLNQVTTPDYRSLPSSVTASQSSIHSVPSKDGRNHTEPAIFPTYGAPIATPEDELFDLDETAGPSIEKRSIDEAIVELEDLCITVKQRSEASEEGEELEERNCFDSHKDEEVEEVKEDDHERTYDKEVEVVKESEEKKSSEEGSENLGPQNLMKNEVEEFNELEQQKDTLELKESENSNPEYTESLNSDVLNQDKTGELDYLSDMKSLTESFGAPKKAILERVELEEGDDELEEYSSDEEPPKLQEPAKLEKPKSLSLNNPSTSSSTTRFSIDDVETPDDFEPMMTGDESVLQQSMLQLQKQLRKSDIRCARLERICEFQQKDIESLRFEMDWKDKRIEYLQKALEEMENAAKK